MSRCATGRGRTSTFGNGRSLLADLDPRAPLRALADRRGERLFYLAAEAGDRSGLEAFLVRPHGIVAWADDGDGDPAEAARGLLWILVPQAAASN